jgi:holo-[acyl-carrier protein] synthase
MGIHGIGVDLVEIKRIRKAAERFGDHFLRRVFTPAELAYAEAKTNPYPHLAARFASKEAFIKSLYPLPITGVRLNEIELAAHDGRNKPDLVFYGQTSEVVDKAGIGAIHVSVSHDHTQAVATVILEK